jgi:hypothetical protein
MKTIANSWRFLIASLYTWIVSLFFGAILLDVAYSNLAFNALQPTERASMFSEVADFLLLIGGFTLLTAVGAIGSSWNLGSPRYWFIASALFIVAEFLVPMLFFPLVQSIGENLGVNVGPMIRLSGNGLASILAFIGLWKLHASRS